MNPLTLDLLEPSYLLETLVAQLRSPVQTDLHRPVAVEPWAAPIIVTLSALRICSVEKSRSLAETDLRRNVTVELLDALTIAQHSALSHLVRQLRSLARTDLRRLATAELLVA